MTGTDPTVSGPAPGSDSQTDSTPSSRAGSQRCRRGRTVPEESGGERADTQTSSACVAPSLGSRTLLRSGLHGDSGRSDAAEASVTLQRL